MSKNECYIITTEGKRVECTVTHEADGTWAARCNEPITGAAEIFVCIGENADEIQREAAMERVQEIVGPSLPDGVQTFNEARQEQELSYQIGRDMLVVGPDGRLVADKAAMEPKMYSIDSIKAAFWATFHESGEVWFNYFGDPEDNERSTASEWHEFLEYLDKAARGEEVPKSARQ